MCVIFWTLDHSDFDLVLASNRDEFLSRPTQPATWHCFQADLPGPILSARDESGGGTWLGITRDGSFAALTNFTELAAPLPDGVDAFSSRGELVKNWLLRRSSSNNSTDDAISVQNYLESLAPNLDHYPGFNLLVGSINQHDSVIGYTTNRTNQGKVITYTDPVLLFPHSTTLSSSSSSHTTGCIGLSNSVLQHPWTKVQQGTSVLQHALDKWDQNKSQTLLENAENQLIDDVFNLLWTPSNPPPTSRTELRTSILIPPLAISTPNQQQPSDWYATRTSTVILIRKPTTKQGLSKATWIERDVYQLNNNTLSQSQPAPNHPQPQRRFDWVLS